MNFNEHPYLVGKHAFLSASSYHWVNYDDDHLATKFLTAQAAQRGTEMHELAARLIRLKVKLPKTDATLNRYVNDCIGFRMTPEQPLLYSENVFGTADAIGFRNNTLRISDLKTGVIAAKITQLEVYAAMFCLEYKFSPFDIKIEMRIYQNDDVQTYTADNNVLMHIMQKIIRFDKLIRELREEALQ